jgi:hypothetical protein
MSDVQTRDQIFDIEEYGRAGREIPPHAQRFRIRIDKQQFTVDVPEMTGRQLLELAGKVPPEQYALYEKLHGGATRKIELTEEVKFHRHGVERFFTLPLDQTEGLVDLRRQFALPEEDVAFLDGAGFSWETVTELGVHRVVIRGVHVPSGYNLGQIDLYFKIEGAYPDTQLDMVYVHPALARADGNPIGGLAEETFDGKAWQRWSRHRTAANPWRPGVDNLETHFKLALSWFEQEFRKR